MAGGHVIGVTTDQIGLQFNVQPNSYLDEIVNYADLRDRLLHMVEHADGYLAMPGGIGTLHEIAETWELMRVGGVPRQPFVCYGRMWADVIAILEESPYLADGYHGMISLARNPEEVMEIFSTPIMKQPKNDRRLAVARGWAKTAIVRGTVVAGCRWHRRGRARGIHRTVRPMRRPQGFKFGCRRR